MTTHGFRRHGPKKPYIFIQKSSFRSLLLELPLHLTGTDHLDFEAASCLMESLCNLNHIVRMLPVQKASTPQNGCFCFAVNQVINAGIPDRLRKVTPFVAPIMILEIVIRPLSLCMRLFGNVLGSFVVMKLLEFICPAILPIPFSLYFDFFDGFIQAYVFVFLTSLFIKEAIE